MEMSRQATNFFKKIISGYASLTDLKKITILLAVIFK